VKEMSLLKGMLSINPVTGDGNSRQIAETNAQAAVNKACI
jgi:hypothetical protein